MIFDADTIVAIATPPGKGGVGVIRISGTLSRQLLEAVTQKSIEPRVASYTRFYDRGGKVIDFGICLFFPAPRSFTGEDVAELHAHGSPIILELLIEELVDRGARMARPGEFSERAFLNGKLDLTQAEAVADLINAGSEQAARSAIRSLEGGFARRINELREAFLHLQVQVETHLDFADEALGEPPNLLPVLDHLRQITADLLAITERAQRLQEGLHIAIIGRPNTGKSSLLNCLCGRDSAIVSDRAGTTRDTVTELIKLGGIATHIVDTAGLRATTDPIETEGIARTWRAAEQADLVFIVIDPETFEPTLDLLPLHHPGVVNKGLLIYNKNDLTGRPARLYADKTPAEIHLSAKTGQGLELLHSYIRRYVGLSDTEETPFSARKRHVEALRQVGIVLQDLGALVIEPDPKEELIAECIRRAQQILGEITGQLTSEDLLGAIFQSFCIGK